jgi:demethylmenaquinone methyltransferase/2-methoxy-6-polyprenyl-1,4-benzoquinol methylase
MTLTHQPDPGSSPATGATSASAVASTTSAGPAWADPELRDPHGHGRKAEKVRRMFAAIAGSYDLNNRVHSLGRDQAWRRFAVKAADVREGERVLDVACGTGDLTQAFADSPAATVVGLDFTHEMLVVAQQKRRTHKAGGKVTYLEGDAMRLPFADASFDVVSIAFGIRNVSEPMKALREFFRVLKPGGRVVILEFERPRFPIARWLNDFYCARIMPITATAIARDTSGAYKYLPASVSTFMDRAKMAGALAEAGFADIKQRGLTLGICVCSWARKA